MDELVNGAAEKQIEEGTATETENTTPVGISKEELDARIEEINRTWQGRFDKILNEKKEKETKVMTVEEEVKLIKAEREAERLSFARERAKLGASIDDELDAAIGLYRSNDADEIKKGADSIKAFFEKMKIAHEADKEKAIKEALAQAGAQPKPKAGDDTPTDLKAQYDKAIADGNGVAALALMEKMQAQTRR